jgi:hypothetical protein
MKATLRLSGTTIYFFRFLFESLTLIHRDKEIESGKVDACGRTEFNGNNDVATQLNQAVAAGLPSTDSTGVSLPPSESLYLAF